MDDFIQLFREKQRQRAYQFGISLESAGTKTKNGEVYAFIYDDSTKDLAFKTIREYASNHPEESFTNFDAAIVFANIKLGREISEKKLCDRLNPDSTLTDISSLARPQDFFVPGFEINPDFE